MKKFIGALIIGIIGFGFSSCQTPKEETTVSVEETLAKPTKKSETNLFVLSHRKNCQNTRRI